MAAASGNAARTTWALGDQVVSAVSNAGLAIAVARTSSASEFGQFSLAMSVYVLVLGLSRAATSDVIAVITGGGSQPDTNGLLAQSAAVAVSVGLLCGSILASVAILVSRDVTNPVWMLGLGLPALVLQDACRAGSIATGQARRALANDGLWAGAQAVLFAVVLTSGSGTPSVLLLCWIVSACAAAVFGCVQLGVVPIPRGSIAWSRQHRRLIPGYMGEFAVGLGGLQLIWVLLGANLGIAAVGAIRGAQTVLGPLNFLWIGCLALTVPEANRRRMGAVGRREVRRYLLRSSIVPGVAVIVAAGILARLLPSAAGVALLGASWESARPLLQPLGLVIAGNCLSIGAIAGIRAERQPAVGFRARVICVIVNLLCTIVGAQLAGVEGAAWGLAAGVGVGALIWWRSFDALGDCTSDNPASWPRRDVTSNELEVSL